MSDVNPYGGRLSVLALYSPECVEGRFSEVGLPLYGVFGIWLRQRGICALGIRYPGEDTQQQEVASVWLRSRRTTTWSPSSTYSPLLKRINSVWWMSWL